MFILHGLILFISLIEIIAIGWLTRIYLYFPKTDPYVHLLVFVFFSAAFSMSEGSRLRNNKLLMIASLLLIITIPIFFYQTIPTYTFEEASVIVQKNEGIERIDASQTTTYDENLQPSHYFISGISNEGMEIAFLFDPFTGEYKKIKMDPQKTHLLNR